MKKRGFSRKVSHWLIQTPVLSFTALQLMNGWSSGLKPSAPLFLPPLLSAWFCSLQEHLALVSHHQNSKFLEMGYTVCLLMVFVCYAGFIGMALSYGLSLNMGLVYSVQNQCYLANWIISVERLNQYTHLTPEAPEIIEETRPPVNWPVTGRVEISDLQASLINTHFLTP